MKRILHVVSSLNVGGLETVALNCVKQLKSNEYVFDFLLLSDDKNIGKGEKEALSLGCNIFRMKKTHLFSFYQDLKKVIQNHGPYEVVHSHVFFASGLVIKAAKAVGVKRCIAHAHSVRRAKISIKRKIIYHLMRWLLYIYADKVVACSKAAGEYVFGKKCFKKKGSVLFNSIEIEKYGYNAERRNEFRDKYGFTNTDFVIGSVGRLVPGKGYGFLLSVFALYKKNDPAAKLLIVGDGDQKDYLEKIVKEKNISDSVVFAGFCSNVNEILSAMDVFISTSNHEGFGIVFLEALCNGLHCIMSSEILVDELKVFQECNVVNSWEKKDWVDKIKLLKLMGRASQNLQRKEILDYSMHSFYENVVSMYEK